VQGSVEQGDLTRRGLLAGASAAVAAGSARGDAGGRSTPPGAPWPRRAPPRRRDRPWAPARQGRRQRMRSPRQDARCWCSRARDRVGGRTLNHELGTAYPGKITEIGGTFRRPDAGPHVRAAQGVRARDVPDLRHGRDGQRLRRPPRALQQQQPGVVRPTWARRSPRTLATAPLAARPDGRHGPGAGAMGRRPTRSSGTARRWTPGARGETWPATAAAGRSPRSRTPSGARSRATCRCSTPSTTSRRPATRRTQGRSSG